MDWAPQHHFLQGIHFLLLESSKPSFLCPSMVRIKSRGLVATASFPPCYRSFGPMGGLRIATTRAIRLACEPKRSSHRLMFKRITLVDRKDIDLRLVPWQYTRGNFPIITSSEEAKADVRNRRPPILLLSLILLEHMPDNEGSVPSH